MSAPVIVIGAGIAGLAAACHLRAQGREVTVVEAQDEPGGRCRTVTKDGFTFDTGATVLTMVDLIDEPLRALGTRLDHHVNLKRLDPAYRACYAGESSLFVRATHEDMRAEISKECGSVDAAAFDEFVVWLRKLYMAEMPHFIDRNFDSPLDLVSRPLPAAKLVALGAFGRYGNAVAKRFSDDRLHRLFSFQALYAGMAPADALAVYAVIAYMDSIEGVWFPEGGMRAVPHAMAAAAAEAGVQFAYGQRATAVLIRGDGAVTGVQVTDGEGATEKLAADAVVCTLDLPVAYEKLLPDLSMPLRLRRPHYSPSAVVWHLGVRGVPEQAEPAAGVRTGKAHHNIHFGRDWNGAFTDLLDKGRLMQDPSRLVCVPSLNDASAAPEGHSTLYVLEPVPNLQVGTVDWESEREPMRERLLTFLDAEGYPTDVVAEEMFTPLEWQRDGMAAGTPFAMSHMFRHTGPFRPANTERRRPGMFFAGSGTVPGVGVPMVLKSGKLAAERVQDYLP